MLPTECRRAPAFMKTATTYYFRTTSKVPLRGRVGNLDTLFQQEESSLSCDWKDSSSWKRRLPTTFERFRKSHCVGEKVALIALFQKAKSLQSCDWKDSSSWKRRLPTLPRVCSTIGAGGLNFSVRNGKRWNPATITTLIAVTYRTIFYENANQNEHDSLQV